MRTVGTKNVIFDPEQEGLSNGRRFLSDREVSRTLVIILDPFIRALSLDTLKHALELTDQEHVLVHANQGISPIDLLFLGYVLLEQISGKSFHY